MAQAETRPHVPRPRRLYVKVYWDMAGMAGWEVDAFNLPDGLPTEGEVPFNEEAGMEANRAAVRADIESKGWVIDGEIEYMPHHPEMAEPPKWDAACVVTREGLTT